MRKTKQKITVGEKKETKQTKKWRKKRIHLPMQGTPIQSLVQEDSTCPGATEPMSHNY